MDSRYMMSITCVFRSAEIALVAVRLAFFLAISAISERQVILILNFTCRHVITSRYTKEQNTCAQRRGRRHAKYQAFHRQKWLCTYVIHFLCLSFPRFNAATYATLCFAQDFRVNLQQSEWNA